METLANLESFVHSAEGCSFSVAARRLALTPAAVSRNVAMLERNLGVRLFQRSTRKLTLTDAGERFLASIGGNLNALQSAIAAVASDSGAPAGPLKVSMSPTFGIDYILPMLPGFLARYPLIRPDWYFENRPVDLIGEGYDAAIGGGFELAPGVVSRALAPIHLVAVASPAFMAGQRPPADPAGLDALQGIVRRSSATGRVRQWVMRDAAGTEVPAMFTPSVVVNDPTAMRTVALLGLGVALLAVPDVLPALESGDLVRVLPQWHVDAGMISIYYATRSHMPARTRVFIDFVVETFERDRLSRRFAGSPD